MQHRRGISLLFAGTHTLDEMITDYWTPYFRSAVPCHVSYLHETEARQLITNPIEDFPLAYEPEAIAFLLEVTNRHPCLIQLACSALVDLKNAQHSHSASLADVQQATAKVLETGDYVLRGVWDWIPRDEREILSVLAMEKLATVTRLAQLLRKPEGTVQRSLDRLQRVEIIEIVDDGNPTPRYRFQVELFRQWVERHPDHVESGTPVSDEAGR